MNYTLSNGKTVKIPDTDIDKAIKHLKISKDEAIQMWLEDNDYLENVEQKELESKAKKVKIQHGASSVNRKNSKPRTVKISEEKKRLFECIVRNLDRCEDVYPENIQILNENKLIAVQIGEKHFKIDITESRKPKG